MPGVVAQEHIARIGVRHHAVDLLCGLHHRAHVVVEAQLEAAVRRDLSEHVKTLREALPAGFVHNGLVIAGQNRRIDLTLNRITLFRNVDAVRADGGKEIELPCKVRDIFFKRLCQQKRREPAACDAHAAQIQLPLELLRILRIFVADLAARKARQRHFTDGLPERILRAELRHVVVAPADRGDAQFHFFRIKHCHGCSPFRFLQRRSYAPLLRPPPRPPCPLRFRMQFCPYSNKKEDLVPGPSISFTIAKIRIFWKNICYLCML